MIYDGNNENETHFSIYKFYIFIYQVTFVYLYNNTQNFNIFYKKAA